jgi:hypothetical protein
VIPVLTSVFPNAMRLTNCSVLLKFSNKELYVGYADNSLAFNPFPNSAGTRLLTPVPNTAKISALSRFRAFVSPFFAISS